MPVLESIATVLAIVGTAIGILGFLDGDYGVAIEIDNFFADVNLVYQGYHTADGRNKNPPKETIRKATKDTAGAFGDYYFWDGSGGSVRYKINGVYCMDIMWSQESEDMAYKIGPSSRLYWNGYFILIGDSRVCDQEISDAYNTFRNCIKNINNQFLQTHKIAEYNSYIYWNDGQIGGYEKRGLNRNDVISFSYESGKSIDIKASMGDQSNAALIVEVGPKEFWKADTYPMYHNVDNNFINNNDKNTHFWFYPNRTTYFYFSVAGLLMIAGVLFICQIFNKIVKYCISSWKSNELKFIQYEPAKMVDVDESCDDNDV